MSQQTVLVESSVNEFSNSVDLDSDPLKDFHNLQTAVKVINTEFALCLEHILQEAKL